MPLNTMKITSASLSDLNESVSCLAVAFGHDPITGLMLQAGPGYHERVSRFFSILMRVRLALKMPVFAARSSTGISGAAMGYTTQRPDWPSDLTEAWEQFENSIPGMKERASIYEELAKKYEPAVPHYYLGVIGTDPNSQGLGIGTKLLKTFCDASGNDPLSSGVYLETAQPSNIKFYERAGFVEVGRGHLGTATLWCMLLSHNRQPT